MKVFRAWLLILMLAIGHAHACHMVWRLPSGQSCTECPRTQELRNEAPAQTEVLTSADCRDCCKLTHCSEEPDAAKATFVAPAMIVMARIEPSPSVDLPPVLPCNPISAVVALHLPNAPPATQSARAPPALLL